MGVMCRLLRVSKSGFYAWMKRPMSARARADVRLTAVIRAVHGYSKGTYGAPRIHAELVLGQGMHVARKRVARLMRAAGLRGVQKRRFVRTTVSDPSERWAPDLVERNFTVKRPNRLWVADLTYVATWEGFLYVAVVIDAFSRRVIGWGIESHLRTELVLAALEMAYTQRAPCQEVIFHSDLRWDPSVTRTTMRLRRASSPALSARSSTETTSGRARKPVRRSSPGSKDGTTLTVVIRPWAISRQSSLNRSSARTSSLQAQNF